METAELLKKQRKHFYNHDASGGPDVRKNIWTPEESVDFCCSRRVAALGHHIFRSGTAGAFPRFHGRGSRRPGIHPVERVLAHRREFQPCRRDRSARNRPLGWQLLERDGRGAASGVGRVCGCPRFRGLERYTDRGGQFLCGRLDDLQHRTVEWNLVGSYRVRNRTS